MGADAPGADFVQEDASARAARAGLGNLVRGGPSPTSLLHELPSNFELSRRNCHCDSAGELPQVAFWDFTLRKVETIVRKRGGPIAVSAIAG